MRDQKLKLRDLYVLHTMGCVGDWNTERFETRLRGRRFESVKGECVI